MNYLSMVAQFHEKYGHQTVQTPTWPSEAIVKLRRKLIEEEAQEFDNACHFENMVEVADALADLLYVTYGAALAFGIPIDAVFAEVHRSNMTKSMLKDEKSIKGKTIKGPDYDPPKIEEVLRREGEMYRHPHTHYAGGL